MIHTITARLNHPQAGSLYQDCYCYDEDSIDLVAEPLVQQTTEVIQSFLKGKPEEITIEFTDDLLHLPKDEGAVSLWLTLKSQDEDGCTYEAEEMNLFIGLCGGPDVWLCNHLFDYFDAPPEEFYCQIKPTSAADQGTP